MRLQFVLFVCTIVGIWALAVQVFKLWCGVECVEYLVFGG